MAEHAHFHAAYISQVLQGPAHFTMEQAALISEYLGHDLDEEQFFLLLVQLGRAGNEKLRQHYQRQIRLIQEKRLVLKNRLGFKKSLSDDQHGVFYGAWYYVAIHVLLTIPKTWDRDSIAKHLSLPVEKVSEALAFMTSTGLIQEEKGRYTVGPVSIHLGEGSPMLARHHSNWRLQAIRSLEQPSKNQLHYSSVATASEKDIPKIRAILVRAIEEARAIIKPSPEERLFCYNLDLFEL
jgi:uncharacterized protein (TIGR02147 family)